MRTHDVLTEFIGGIYHVRENSQNEEQEGLHTGRAHRRPGHSGHPGRYVDSRSDGLHRQGSRAVPDYRGFFGTDCCAGYSVRSLWYSSAFCTFFAPRVSKIQVVAKMHKMHTIQNKRQRKRAFAPFSLFNSTNGKQNQT